MNDIFALCWKRDIIGGRAFCWDRKNTEGKLYVETVKIQKESFMLRKEQYRMKASRWDRENMEGKLDVETVTIQEETFVFRRWHNRIEKILGRDCPIREDGHFDYEEALKICQLNYLFLEDKI